jgi:hypothetical protein
MSEIRSATNFSTNEKPKIVNNTRATRKRPLYLTHQYVVVLVSYEYIYVEWPRMAYLLLKRSVESLGVSFIPGSVFFALCQLRCLNQCSLSPEQR